MKSYRKQFLKIELEEGKRVYNLDHEGGIVSMEEAHAVDHNAQSENTLIRYVPIEEGDAANPSDTESDQPPGTEPVKPKRSHKKKTK